VDDPTVQDEVEYKARMSALDGEEEEEGDDGDDDD